MASKCQRDGDGRHPRPRLPSMRYLMGPIGDGARASASIGRHRGGRPLQEVQNQLQENCQGRRQEAGGVQSEVRDRGHLVLTPLILTQPSGLQGTAAECGQTGLGMEEAEAMDMERD